MTARRTPTRARHRTSLLVGLALASTAAVTGCQGSTTTPATDSGTSIQVVAAEGVWGDIAGELGGTQVHVTTIESAATPDSAEYEPTAADTKVIGAAQVFILTGAGLDPWANQAAGADPGIGRLDVNVGDEVGVAPGGDPYLWFNTSYVRTAARQIEADYIKLRPDQTTYFQQQEESFEQGALTTDQNLAGTISTKYGGTQVGACTPLGSALATQLGLKSDDPVTAAQITGREVKLLLCDAQKPGPVSQALLTAAEKAGIPVVMLSETLEPTGATYQQWMSGQLQEIEQALS